MYNLYKKAYERLPERFRKPNNLDLYYTLYGGYGDLVQVFKEIRDSRNLDKAEGQTLDYLGANIGQFRSGEDDDLYRLLIKTRIIANLSIGDKPTIDKVMSILVKDNYYGVQEVWRLKEYDNEPAALILRLGNYASAIPFEIINRIKAGGVRVLFELLEMYELDLITRYGAYNYISFLCGEHPCGEIPDIYATAERFETGIDIETGSNAAKNYYPTVNKIKSGDSDFGEVETIYASDVENEKIYEWREEE